MVVERWSGQPRGGAVVEQNGKAKQGELPWFNFDEVPPVGLRIRYRRRIVTLIAVEPYTRKDGAASVILHWRGDDGAEGTSGCKGNDWTRKTKPAPKTSKQALTT